MVEVEAQHRGVFAATTGIGELANHGAVGRHEGGVPGIDLIGHLLVDRQKMAGNARVFVGIHHLPVLPHGKLLIEATAAAQRVACQR